MQRSSDCLPCLTIKTIESISIDDIGTSHIGFINPLVFIGNFTVDFTGGSILKI